MAQIRAIYIDKIFSVPKLSCSSLMIYGFDVQFFLTVERNFLFGQLTYAITVGKKIKIGGSLEEPKFVADLLSS
jgi:hypothetical protein